MRRQLLAISSLLLALLLGASTTAEAASKITIVVNDGAGEGFNDPTAVAPVGGNTATTLGQQRLIVFQKAAEIWGNLINSPVEILVRSQFDAQTCSASGAVLGSAGTLTIHRDFTNAPVAGTWYHQALANSLAGSDLDPATPDINATFNSALDTGCLPGTTGWYYGIEPGAPTTQIALLPVVLHELAHGLGFANFVNEATGAQQSGFPDIYSVFTFDDTTGLFWTAMNDAQRVASAINTFNVVWTGPRVTVEAADYLGDRPELSVTAPPAIAGDKIAQAATFGAALTNVGLSGPVTLVNDGTGTTTDACEAMTPGSLAGTIALIDRGTCTFIIKVKNAQDAGAIGAIIANNAASGLPGMGGTDATIIIPSLGIQQADGTAIKGQLPAPGVTATLRTNAARLAGADTSGNVLLNAPNPVQLGSSISHFDPLTTPNTLMEPAINVDLFRKVDLTKAQLEDIGWKVVRFADGFEWGDKTAWSTSTP